MNPWTTLDRLRAAADAGGAHPAFGRLAGATHLVRERTDSIRESMLRLCLVRLGLPCPYINFEVVNDAGHRWAYIDLAYPELKIAIEYDGVHHRESDAVRQADNARLRALEAAGWTVIRATAQDLRNPEPLIRAILAAIAASGKGLPRSH